VVTHVRQRLDIIGRPRAGVFHQRNAHAPHLLANIQSDICRPLPDLGLCQEPWHALFLQFRCDSPARQNKSRSGCGPIQG
jgi:hypothetical protein